MAKKKKKAAGKRKPVKVDQSELAEDLARFINPEDEQFDLDFTIELLRLRPDWFTAEERERVVSWAKAKRKRR